MANTRNDFFERMCGEAMDELASGERGSWREVSPNVLIMACFGMLTNHLSGKLLKPLWFAGSSICAAAIVVVVRNVFFGG